MNAMKRFDTRIIFGVMLLMGGGLMLMQAMGMLKNASDIFWGGVFLVAGAAFLSLLISGEWWAAFPGFTLAAIGVLILLPDSLDNFGGAVFLGGIGLAFWMVYLMDRAERWWALIPAGVLTTLAVVSVLPGKIGMFETGGVFFLGLAATFLLVALLAKMRWAFWPAGVLGIMGFLATVTLMDFSSYIWAVILIGAGAYLLLKYFTNK